MKEKEIKQKQLTKDLEWKDISHERIRVYIFPNNQFTYIENPIKINISKSGGHRILDTENVSHYIPFKWIHLFWVTKDNIAFRF